MAGPGRHGSGEGGDVPPELHLGRNPLAAGHGLRSAGAVGSSGGRGRLRGEEEHPALPCGPRAPRDGRAGEHRRRGDHGTRAGRHRPLERSRRPGRHGQIRGAGHPEAGGHRKARLRDLPWPPDAGPRPRRPHREDGHRPPRRQPSDHEPRHRPDRDHQPEPRFRRGSGEPSGGGDANPHKPVRRHPGWPPGEGKTRLLGAVPPGSPTWGR